MKTILTAQKILSKLTPVVNDEYDYTVDVNPHCIMKLKIKSCDHVQVCKILYAGGYVINGFNDGIDQTHQYLYFSIPKMVKPTPPPCRYHNI